LEGQKQHLVSSLVIRVPVIVYIIRINMIPADVLAETIEPVIKVMKIPEFQ
jgi:GTPase